MKKSKYDFYLVVVVRGVVILVVSGGKYVSAIVGGKYVTGTVSAVNCVRTFGVG
jgi:hypothetical protein